MKKKRKTNYRSVRKNRRRKDKFTEIIRNIFDKRSEIFISRDPIRSAYFLFVKTRLICKRISLECFKAERKLVKVVGKREFFYFRWEM